MKDIVNLAFITIRKPKFHNQIKDWSKGECELIPGKTMHSIVVVERDYTKIYDKFISLGPNMKNGMGAHGNSYDCADFYENLLDDRDHVQTVKGVEYPSFKDDEKQQMQFFICQSYQW